MFFSVTVISIIFTDINESYFTEENKKFYFVVTRCFDQWIVDKEKTIAYNQAKKQYDKEAFYFLFRDIEEQHQWNIYKQHDLSIMDDCISTANKYCDSASRYLRNKPEIAYKYLQKAEVSCAYTGRIYFLKSLYFYNKEIEDSICPNLKKSIELYYTDAVPICKEFCKKEE